MNLDCEDQLDVVILWPQQVNLLDALSFFRKPTKTGWELTSLATRKIVWEVWHSNCTYSTITLQPAKFSLSNKKYIKAGVDFMDTVTIISQRNNFFNESNWLQLITTKTCKQLFNEYLSSNNESPVSHGTFIALKGYLCYKMITPQNVLSQAQVKNFFIL